MPAIIENRCPACSKVQVELTNPTKSASTMQLPCDVQTISRPPLRYSQVCPAIAGRRLYRGAISGDDEGAQRCHRGEVRPPLESCPGAKLT
jgi:hypothetical protein